MCLTARNFGLHEENINISRERPLTRKTGRGTTVREGGGGEGVRERLSMRN